MPTIVNDRKFLVSNFIELIDKYGFKSMRQTNSLNEWTKQFNLV